MSRWLLLFWLIAGGAAAQVPSQPSSCGLGLASVQSNLAAFSACLDPSVPKTDWENLSLAVIGPKLWPGNQDALLNARNWIAQIDADLIGGYGLGVPVTGSATDVASWHILRNASYTGGTAGFVNSAFRADTTVGAGATAFEWSILGAINSSAASGENVGVYGQGYGRANGPVWGMVAEAHAFGNGNAIGLEVDSAKASGATGTVIGIDVVNYGNMTYGLRLPCDVPAVLSANDPTTFISFPCKGGGVQITSHGKIVQTW